MNEKTPQKPQNSAPSRCPEAIQRNLKAYADGELNFFGRRRAARHIAQCEACREETLWLQKFAQELREQEAATPRPELRARILASLPDAPVAVRPADPRRAPFLAPRYATGAALLLVATLGGAFALKSAGIWGSASAPPQAVNAPPPSKSVAEAAATRKIVLPDDTENINQKADALFQQKMRNIVAKPPAVQVPAPIFDATEATADVPQLGFAPAEATKASDYVQRVAQTVHQMGGAVEGIEANAAPSAFTIHIPAKRVTEMFRQARRFGNFSKSAKPHGANRPVSPAGQDSTSRRQMRVPFPAKGDEDRNLTLTPDDKGFVTLRVEVKPNAGK